MYDAHVAVDRIVAGERPQRHRRTGGHGTVDNCQRSYSVPPLRVVDQLITPIVDRPTCLEGSTAET